MPLKKTAVISLQKMRNFLRKKENFAVPLRKKRHLRFILPGRKIKNMTAWKHRHRKKWNRCPVSVMYRKINWWMYVWIIFRIIQNVISQRAQRIMTIMTACSRNFPAMNWKNTRKKRLSRQRQQWSILRRILYTRSAALSKKPMCAGMN